MWKDVKVYKGITKVEKKIGDTREIEGEQKRDLRERGRREERCRYTKEMRIEWNVMMWGAKSSLNSPSKSIKISVFK